MAKVQDKIDSKPDLMTSKEVAKHFNVSIVTLYAWAKKGSIPGKQLGSRWYFSRKVIENLVC